MNNQTQTDSQEAVVAGEFSSIGKDLIAAILVVSLVGNLFAVTAWLAVTLQL